MVNIADGFRWKFGNDVETEARKRCLGVLLTYTLIKYFQNTAMKRNICSKMSQLRKYTQNVTCINTSVNVLGTITDTASLKINCDQCIKNIAGCQAFQRCF